MLHGSKRLKRGDWELPRMRTQIAPFLQSLKLFIVVKLNLAIFFNKD
jgi:hypothetical protein